MQCLGHSSVKSFKALAKFERNRCLDFHSNATSCAIMSIKYLFGNSREAFVNALERDKGWRKSFEQVENVESERRGYCSAGVPNPGDIHDVASAI